MEVTSCARISDSASDDSEFTQVAELYRGRSDFDLTALIIELVESEAVPYLPAMRHKPSGMLKRVQWVRTWELQRREDEIDARVKLPEGDPTRLTADEAVKLKARIVGNIPVPPKYKSVDFIKRELSAGVRRSETVALGYPLMPVADGLGG